MYDEGNFTRSSGKERTESTISRLDGRWGIYPELVHKKLTAQASVAG